jgi:hypothetical protein
MFSELPQELIYTIFKYAGELRLLKRKMTKENIHQIINDNYDAIGFMHGIVDRPIRTGPPIYYFVYWEYLSLLSGSMIRFKLSQKDFDKLNYVLTNDYYLDKLMTVFINDYNNYYLDDYYYNLCWVDGRCYIDYNHYDEDIDDEVKRKWEIEEHRWKVFNEICDYIYPPNLESSYYIGK